MCCCCYCCCSLIGMRREASGKMIENEDFVENFAICFSIVVFFSFCSLNAYSLSLTGTFTFGSYSYYGMPVTYSTWLSVVLLLLHIFHSCNVVCWCRWWLYAILFRIFFVTFCSSLSIHCLGCLTLFPFHFFIMRFYYYYFVFFLLNKL